jgi:hypothetical protein
MNSRSHLRAVPDPAAEVVGDLTADLPGSDDEPTGLLADALADAPPGSGGPRHLETVDTATDLLADALSDVLDGGLRKHGEGERFLRLVEAAEKVTPLDGDGTDLAPSQLLDMLDGAAGQRPATAAEATKAELMKRLCAAAWDVVRAGVAEDEPELQKCLVHICNFVQDGSDT